MIDRTACRFDGDDFVVMAGDFHLTTDAAIDAGGFGPAIKGPCAALVKNCASGAGVGAGTTRDAAAAEQAFAICRGDMGLLAFAPDFPDKLSLYFITDTHAALAVYAPVHVYAQIRVAVILENR